MKSRHILAAVCLGILVSPRVAIAQPSPEPAPGTAAFGLMLGVPVGLSFKRWLGRDAWDVAVGVGPGLRIHADYLFTLGQLFAVGSATSLDAYAGVGPVIGVYSGWCGRLYDPGFRCGDGGGFGGARVPVGVDLRLALPFDIAVEAAPGIAVDRSGGFFLLDAAIYARLLL